MRARNRALKLFINYYLGSFKSTMYHLLTDRLRLKESTSVGG